MNRVQHVRRAGAGAVAFGIGAVMVFGWGPSASAAPPESLASFAAQSSAVPYGVVSRVPVESAGGFLYSQSGVRLGKATAKAAGFTAGELGDVFIVSSSPPGTITSMPTVINAQEPPSDTAPRESRLTGGTSGSPTSGQVQNFDLLAKATDAPAGNASAVGQGITSLPFTSGLSTSRSESIVSEDGTVATKAISTVQNVVIGPAATGLSIAAVESIASITIPPGGKPVTDLRITMSGATLGGVPVTIDSRGVRISDQVALPPDALAAFKSGLDSLAAQGLFFEPSPREETVTADGAKLSGAVFQFRYRYPDAFPRPSDIGTDETFQLAAVTAEATARQRTAPPPTTDVAQTPVDSAAAPVVDENAPIAAEPGVTPDLGAPAVGAPEGGTPSVGLPGTTPTAAQPDVVFALPTRVADPLPGQARDSYRYVMLAAVAGIGAVIVLRKSIV